LRNEIVGVVVVAMVGMATGFGCATTPSEKEVLRGPQLEGPEFDRRGADFTGWLDDFEKKTHYNWEPPTYFGYGGGVDFVFTVERNGSISTLEMLKSSGTEAMEQAARHALSRSRFEPLPQDFGRARVTMRITFHYNRPPGD